jgi:SAM-dependent methyltransferase
MKKTSQIEATLGSPDRFGYEWTKYSDILKEYEEQFLRWMPFLAQKDWRNISFIDVGCGMGRNSYWPLSYGASFGVAIDMDQGSLNSAKKNLSGFNNIEIKLESAYNINYSNKFDIAFSIGVIHHLEFPHEALKEMFNAVKPGGHVAIWVYGYENNEWIVNFFNPFRKLLFSKLSIKLVHHLSLYPALFLYFFIKLNLINLDYFKLLKKFKFSHIRSIVFDQMLPRISNYWKREEVENLMRDAGLIDIRLENVNNISWASIGKKPN